MTITVSDIVLLLNLTQDLVPIDDVLDFNQNSLCTQFEDEIDNETFINQIINLARLDARETEVIFRNFGILGYPDETLQEISIRLNTSRSNTKRIRQEALVKIKDAVCRYNIEL